MMTNPDYRFLYGAPYQTLTQGTTSSTPFKYASLTAADATFLKSVSDPTVEIEYDYTVCPRPTTFGLDPVV